MSSFHLKLGFKPSEVSEVPLVRHTEGRSVCKRGRVRSRKVSDFA